MKPTLNELYKNENGQFRSMSIVYGDFLERFGGDYSILELVEFRNTPLNDTAYSAPWSEDALKEFDKYITKRKMELMKIWTEE